MKSDEGLFFWKSSKGGGGKAKEVQKPFIIYHTWYFLPAVLIFVTQKLMLTQAGQFTHTSEHNSWMLSFYKFQFSWKSASLLRLTFIQLFMAQVPVQCYILLAFLSRLLCLGSGKPYFISLLLNTFYVTKRVCLRIKQTVVHAFISQSPKV